MTTTKIPPRLEARQQPWQLQPAKDQASGSRSSLNELAEKPYCEPNVVQREEGLPSDFLSSFIHGTQIGKLNIIRSRQWRS